MKKKNLTIKILAGLLSLSLLTAACSVPLKESSSPAEGSTAAQTAEETKTPAQSTADPAAAASTAAPETAAPETAATAAPVKRFFETRDLNNQPVYVSDVCAANKVVMLNFWASWCPPCVRELPDLEALYQKYKDAGVAVVGVLLDGAESTGLKDGKELLQKAGVSYLNVLPTRELESLTSLMYVPTTIFLNEKGEMVGDAVVGADLDAYEERIKAMLP